MYTATENGKLNELQGAYDKALADYTLELSQNSQGKQAQPTKIDTNGVPYYTLPFLWGGSPIPQNEFMAWLSASNTSLETKKQLAATAKINLDDYKQFLSDKYKLQFQLENPDAYIAGQQIAGQSLVEAAKISSTADAQTEAEKAKQKNIRTFVIIGVIIVLVGLGTWAYFKYFKKSK